MKILLLASYPAEPPQHGGQHRLLNIAHAYRAAGHEVAVAGVLGHPGYPGSDGFEPYPADDVPRPITEAGTLMDDWGLGQLYAGERYQALAHRVAVDPDVIHVEQPWLFAFARRLAAERTGGRARLVYGSQNIEYRLKRDNLRIVLGDQAPAEVLDAATERVLQCELDAIRHAHLVCCVSEPDLAWTAERAHVPCILAPNGVTRRVTELAGLAEANRITDGRKFALFCASAHPPNIVGFFDMLAPGLGCIAPDEALVVAGSAGPAIRHHPRFSKVARLGSVYRMSDVVDEACLQGLLATAHAILLPLTHGGGTNLKTAEALWAGRHVIATPTALRGFERFQASPGVQVAGDPSGFLQALGRAMTSPPLELDAAERDARSVVLWERTLAKLVSAVSALETRR